MFQGQSSVNCKDQKPLHLEYFRGRQTSKHNVLGLINLLNGWLCALADGHFQVQNRRELVRE
uniref:Uncharacterized protein n=1 Tax=Ascaris lumbricoides TaxID=6252 RepID=A0A9J2Q830_ASCLU